jgi:hypothetical protein
VKLSDRRYVERRLLHLDGYNSVALFIVFSAIAKLQPRRSFDFYFFVVMSVVFGTSALFCAWSDRQLKRRQLEDEE